MISDNDLDDDVNRRYVLKRKSSRIISDDYDSKLSFFGAENERSAQNEDRTANKRAKPKKEASRRAEKSFANRNQAESSQARPRSSGRSSSGARDKEDDNRIADDVEVQKVITAINGQYALLVSRCDPDHRLYKFVIRQVREGVARVPFARRCYYLRKSKKKQAAVMDRVIAEVSKKLPEYDILLREANKYGILKTVVRRLRSDETKLVHRFYNSLSFGKHACALLKKRTPASSEAMDKFLTKNMRKKFLGVGAIQEEKKTTKVGDKVLKKTMVLMTDTLKSSLIYLGEDVGSCRERLPIVMAVAAEAVQIVETELSFRDFIREHMPIVSLAFTLATLRRYVATEKGWRKCSRQVEFSEVNLVFKTLRQQLLALRELKGIDILDVKFELPRSEEREESGEDDGVDQMAHTSIFKTVLSSKTTSSNVINYF